MIDQVLLGLQALFLVILYTFIWRVVRAASSDLHTAEETAILAAPQAPARDQSSRNSHRLPARLVIVRGDALPVGMAYEVGPVPITIGRGDENLLRLLDDDYVSAHHARVEAGRDRVWIVDLDSTNGTLVNGQKVGGRQPLHDGDLVQIGATEMRIEL